jgi:hypothetical protein
MSCVAAALRQQVIERADSKYRLSLLFCPTAQKRQIGTLPSELDWWVLGELRLI